MSPRFSTISLTRPHSVSSIAQTISPSGGDFLISASSRATSSGLPIGLAWRSSRTPSGPAASLRVLVNRACCAAVSQLPPGQLTTTGCSGRMNTTRMVGLAAGTGSPASDEARSQSPACVAQPPPQPPPRGRAGRVFADKSNRGKCDRRAWSDLLFEV